MARSVNVCHFIGNLGRDAATSYTPSGIAKTTFSIATERKWKDKQSGEWKTETDWVPVVLWRSENLANYLLKGTSVYVQGRYTSRSYEKDGEKKYITEIVADVVNLLGSKGGGERQQNSHDDGGYTSGGTSDADDSGVPF